MKVSLNWLNELVNLKDKAADQIAHELTMSGLEVEAIEVVKPQFKNIITAKIEKIDQHPNADKLHLVTVNIGNAVKTVVCGAQNIEEGQIIPYASVGSEVFSRKTGEMFTLTPAVIRGVESQGMLCSSDELGLSERGYQEEDGILILNRFLSDIKLGEPLEKVLGIEDDILLDVAPTANRGDLMSIVGVARELSAIFDRPMNFSYLEPTKDFSTNDFQVEIKDEDVCKYYSIGLLKGVKIKPSPDWMQKKLISAGFRAINNVVDITNFVLLEYGCPLHAFDADKLQGYLCVRRADEGEKIITLDETERTLTRESVLIATKERGVCLAGVFGGANSEIDDKTTAIALEAAYFPPATTRRSARSVGYRSEASARFERGVDIGAVKPALMRAMQLLADYADAKIVGMVETGKNELAPVDITLRFAQIKRILGSAISAEKCIAILTRLGFELLGKNEAAAKFRVPSFRVDDVYREVDLIEEVSRIDGFDKIEPTLPAKSQMPFISLEEKTLEAIAGVFSASGLNEIITTSLIGKSLMERFGLAYDEEKSVKVKNAASEEYTMLRQTLVGNILTTLKYNYDNGQKDFWAYEIGRTYFKEREATEKDSGVTEKRMLSGVLSGNVQNSLWQQTGVLDFYTIKGILEKLFAELKIDSRIRFNPAKSTSWLHPHKSAEIVLLGKNVQTIGVFGEIHPALKAKMKLNQEAYVFEINLDEILAAVNETVPRFKKLAQYPEIQRDLAFVISQDVTCEDIKKIIKKSVANNIFKGCDVFDVYQGEHIAEGFKSVAFRIKMQDENTTLTDEVIDTQIKSVRVGLEKAFSGVTFRE